jgi:hypothetical protein
VLLTLVVIAVWEDFGRARETVESEANATAEVCIVPVPMSASG